METETIRTMAEKPDIYRLFADMNVSDGAINETLKHILDHYRTLNKPPEQSMYPEECHNWVYWLDIFYWYYIPTVCVGGLVGNLLSCLVFLQTHLKMRSSSYYLAALSAADFGFLASILLVWVNNKLGVPIFNRDGWCQSMVYTSSVCSFLSVWLTVSFTVERFIAVQYPLHRPRVCTVARAKMTVTVLLLVSLTVHCYVFFSAGIIRTNDGDVCELRETYHELMRVINIVDTVVTLILPVGLIVVMNTMIAKNLFRFSRRFGHPPETNSNRSDIQLCPTFIQTNSSNSHGRTRTVALRMSTGVNLLGSFHSICSNSRDSRTQSSQQQIQNVIFANVDSRPSQRGLQMRSTCGNLMSTRIQRNITKMLLLVSTVFVSLNLPSYVIRLYIFFRFSIWQMDTPGYLWCAQQMFMLLYYTNFCINFLLYNMCGITFRRCLFQLIRNFFRKFREPCK